MAAIEESSNACCTELFAAADWRSPAVWQDVAHRTWAWCRERQLCTRDVVVLLPFAALLTPLREAFAAVGGWQPRVETTLTLAASLAPPPPVAAGLCGGGTLQDRLFAAQLLKRQSWAQAWADGHGSAFEVLTAALVQATQQFGAAVAQREPSTRADFWAQARAAVGSAGPSSAGPAATEAALLRVALEWAQLSYGETAAATDVLFTFKPVAWVLVRVGGVDAVAEAVAAAGIGRAVPALIWQLDPKTPVLAVSQDAVEAGGPQAELGPDIRAGLARAQVQQLLCDDFEAEAQAAAASVITALNEGRVPVALVALDRALVRRVRALLDRSQVPLVDETGWHLATTRAASVVMALLRAVAPGAGPDAWLEWIKWAHADSAEAVAAVDALEAQWRGRRITPLRRALADHLWLDVQADLAPLRQAAAQGAAHPLADWLRWSGAALRLHTSSASAPPLRAAGSDTLAALWRQADGAQVVTALQLFSPPSIEDSVLQQALAALPLTLDGFIAWVSTTLQDSPFLPLPGAGAQVVLTPLARVFGRNFGHTVMPGADHQHLGSVDVGPGLISDSLARLLGLPDRAARRVQQRLALLHSLRSGPVTLLRRQREDGEPLAESPDVAWLAMHLGPQGWPMQRWQPLLQRLPLQPVHPPLPSAANALPASLSASALEALRQCPYRFFVRAVLRLDEPEELDLGLAKRDYGTWLHAVLHRFHSEREHARANAAQLQAAAEWATSELALDEGELLPYRASFEHFAPAYLAWLAERERHGWFWADGESDHSLSLVDEDSGDGGSAWLQLKGRIDRLDHGPDNQSQLLDYKTGSAEALARKVRQPLEDTQLAFYAAVLGAAAPGDVSLRAAYLALDGAQAPCEIEHPQVAASARQLLLGLRGEWQRLRQGAALPALGEGAVCEVCEARGLCRRDQWTAQGETLPNAT